MQIKTKHLLTMLVVAGISSVALPSKAATTVYEAGDLLLGFRSTSTPANSVVVNVTGGTFANMAALRDSTSTGTVIMNINSVLTDAYGSNWATQTDLFWGAVGVYSNSSFDPTVDGDPARTVYASKVNGAATAGAQSSTALSASTSTALGNIANAVAGFQQSFAGYNDAPTTFNSGLSAKIPTANANTWEDFTSTSSDFVTGGNIEGVVGNGQTVLDLYRILGGTTGFPHTGSWEGTLSLASNGDVVFTASTAAVPEPSRALLLLGGVSALFMRRRRRA